MENIRNITQLNEHMGVDTEEGEMVARNWRMIRYTPDGKDQLERESDPEYLASVKKWEDLVQPDELRKFQKKINVANDYQVAKKFDQEYWIAEAEAHYWDKVKEITGFQECQEEREAAFTQLMIDISDVSGALSGLTDRDMHMNFVERLPSGPDVGEFDWDKEGFNRLLHEQDKERINYKPFKWEDNTWEYRKEWEAKRFDNFVMLKTKVLNKLAERNLSYLASMNKELLDMRDNSFISRTLEMALQLPANLTTHEKALRFLHWRQQKQARSAGKEFKFTPKQKRILDLYEESRMLTKGQLDILMELRKRAEYLAHHGYNYMKNPDFYIKKEENILQVGVSQEKMTLYKLEQLRERYSLMKLELEEAIRNIDGDRMVFLDKEMKKVQEEAKEFMALHNLKKEDALWKESKVE